MTRLAPVDSSTASEKSSQLLAGVQKKLGMTPNMMSTMAQSSAVLDAYLKFSAALGDGELSAKTREQIALTVGQANQCVYCLSAHSAIGKMVGLSAGEIRDARTGTAADPKTEAILWVAAKLVEKRGLLSDDDVAAAKDAGITDGELAEVVANTALNLFTNYFNHVAETEVDFPSAEPLETVA
ncbi:carboxymuconolactone decarboxylase family protein [Stieleria sp. JC731]|uniref:carboxymuconolactone decarboxylase family protein n=1 Tax=Pirellulaceae TaxID=2691357 RepID=UPI001E2AD491|nr:carboxymuconolactone decarboxylase family protein [Stieleria sp. JC731]MCC9600970.1 carboxymuconolactone decarboxylase family protein [Stieleria sp. JC731]